MRLILRIANICFKETSVISGIRYQHSKPATKMSTGLSLDKIVKVLEEFAPKSLSEKWDNTGVLIEPYTPRPIFKILLTNDLTERVMEEAKSSNAQMIISYHPPIFSSMKSVTQRTWKERIVSCCLERGVAVYSPHTAWDAVPGGVNDWLASCLPEHTRRPIQPAAEPAASGTGAGRLCELHKPLLLSKAVHLVKQLTNLQHVRLAMATDASSDPSVQRVAICAGSGGSLLRGVNADLYLTGEMLHHDVLEANHSGASVILTNHSDSERGFLSEFAPKLEQLLEYAVKVIVSSEDRDPLTTV